MIDTLPAQPGFGGVEAYVRALVRALESCNCRTQYHLLLSNSNAQLFAQSGLPKSVLNIDARNPLIRVFAQQIIMPIFAKYHRFDLIFETRDVGPLPSLVPFVVTVHSPHLNLQQGVMRRGVVQRLYNRIGLRLSALRARRLIFISEFARRTFESDIQAVPGKSVVIPHGADFVPFDSSSTTPSTESRDGVLFLSSLFRHKHPDVAIRAYRHALDLVPSIGPLRIVGRDFDSLTPNLRDLAKTLGVASRVAFFGRVPSSDLPRIFDLSRVLIFPSTIEGFGIPVVEAMARGTAVVAARAASLPEVAGKAALFFEPGDWREAGKLVAALFDNRLLIQRCVDEGRRRSRQYTWLRCARSTDAVLTAACAKES